MEAGNGKQNEVIMSLVHVREPVIATLYCKIWKEEKLAKKEAARCREQI